MATAPVRYDIVTYAGESETIEITIEDEGGTPDLGGATLTYQLAAGRGGEALLELAGTLDGAVATIQIADTDTADLAPGLYWHESRLAEITGRMTVVMEGHMVVQPSITQPAI